MTQRERQALKWMASSDTGVSSESLVVAALGLERGEFQCDAPYDPADLGRCLRMLQRLPWVKEKAFRKLRTHDRWKIAIKNWDAMSAMMEKEVGIDWRKGRSAPMTYAFMKGVGL